MTWAVLGNENHRNNSIQLAGGGALDVEPYHLVLASGCVPRRKAEDTRKERKTRKRNLTLLSFGEQAEEEEQHLAAAAAVSTKIKSAHEVLRGDGHLLATEETPAEVLAEQQARAAALKGVQDKLKGKVTKLHLNTKFH